jgi:Domain of unknown function (DUF3576)
MRSGSALRVIWSSVVIGLAGCNNPDLEPPERYRNEQTDRIRDQYGTVWGDGTTLFQRGTGRFAREDGNDGGAYAGIGVNAYLWRASLETINFLPLTQADPFGGVIITDWYSPPETPTERFKLNVYVLDTVLRADGIKVAVFRQVQDDGGWRDAAVDPKTGTDIEDQILTKARELRIAASNVSG